MTDQELLDIYVSGNAQSHLAGLRAVYEAGRDTDAKIEQSVAALERGLVKIDE